jgi:hypothetical protein
MDRARLGLTVVFASLACTRPNPAFDADSLGAGSSDEVGESRGTSDASEGESSEGESSESSETDTTGVVDLPEDPACKGGHPFSLRYDDPQTLDPANCPGVSGDVGLLYEMDGALVLNLCTDACQICGDAFIPIEIDYDLSPLLQKCLLVEAENPVQEGEWCRYEAMSIFDGAAPSVPYMIAANRLLPTGSAMQLLGGWPKLLVEQGVPVPDTTCTCAEAGIDENCCVGEQPFTTYSMRFDGMTVDVGQSAWVGLPSSVYDYEFYVAMAQQRASCTMTPELAWKLVAVLP